MTAALTGWVKSALLEIQEYTRLAIATAKGSLSRPFYIHDFVEQLDRIGIGSLTVVVLTGFFTGAVLALQSGFTLDQFGARPAVGRLVSATMIKELGAVLTALMLTGRVSSGIAAELGAMAVTDQINALRALGTDPVRKLVVPRVLAGIIMTPILTVVANTVGLVGAWIVATQKLQIASSLYWTSVVDGLYMEDVWMGLLKPFFLGFIVVTVGCHVGLRTRGGTEGVGRSTTNAVVAASVGVIAIDFFSTQLLLAVLFCWLQCRPASVDRRPGGPATRRSSSSRACGWRSTTRSCSTTSASGCTRATRRSSSAPAARASRRCSS